ncbi:uncharacterized protein LOC144466863 [Epinephelus lanceolatus]
MTAFGKRCLSHEQYSAEQIERLQRAIQETRRQLAEVRQKTQRAEDEILECKRESERRWDLMKDTGECADGLQQLGCLLQEERHLSEQLNGQDSADSQGNDLQERSKCLTDKATSLTAEIQKVKEHLAEAKARNVAAQALVQAPTSKSKRNQQKFKAI